ncbi:LD-carboxypeptidase [Alteromonas sp. 5E99-2]|uniref:S66 family peptidase n=1 Tax=Alteromonas sp. 5E99-2 TaxID=2817683 RepID=UPI001A98D2A1|nr:S66 peptidase family protein [Alteromonas sp. 5E99-2]MBO1257059.1 LD-carboxypeptidase [Alteromonas sp. 5E99-2]
MELAQELIKPKRLLSGDKVAVLSPSWGGPFVFPDVYEKGLRVLMEWGLEVVEYPSTRMNNDSTINNVKARAQDINNAFSDPEIKALFITIGGDDLVLLLPYLNPKVIKANPKIVMGFSDTTVLNVFCYLKGMITFNGPSIMAGFSQMAALPETYRQHVYDLLFSSKPTYTFPIYESFSDGFPDWSVKENLGKVNKPQLDTGIRVLQGHGVISGTLFGGCLEVLEFIKGTEYWPTGSFWRGKIIFLETSEEKPSVNAVKRILRNYGTQGVYEQINALMIANPMHFSLEEKLELDNVIRSVVSVEFGITNLPIITNVMFGHTDPKIVMPLGAKMELNLDKKILRLLESVVA